MNQYSSNNTSLQLPIVALVGPTAAGKTTLSVALAQALKGEVINADSMQLYRGLDIGTAKITDVEKRGIPHHMFDILDITQTADVVHYQSVARETIDNMRFRGQRPVLVGGSGLYVQAVTDVMDFPGKDLVIRTALESELEQVGSGALWKRLQEKDSKAAENIHPGNGRKIVRALEVIALTGSFKATLPEKIEHYPTIRIGIDLDTDLLDARIEQRVQHMWDAGLIEETRELEKQGLREGVTASRALGYHQVLQFLAGEFSEKEAFERTVQKTRRFVRRQRSWFKRDSRIQWLDAADANVFDKALELANQGI